MKLRTFAVLFLALVGCSSEAPAPSPGPQPVGPTAAPSSAAPAASAPAPSGFPTGPVRALLIAQSAFKANPEGKYTLPDAASLILLAKQGDGWVSETITDRESNVFHKAMPYGREGLLTIGGNDAYLKLWKRAGGEWTAMPLWHPTFGGQQNRLRDFEQGDLDQDGLPDLAIATHDQGVVAVAFRRGESFEFHEIDRAPNTFVHEIEIGDLDGDKKPEIYATPSQPNKLTSDTKQGGAITRYVWNGKTFERSIVEEFATRHVKEVFAGDVDGDGKDELYAAIEAETQGGADGAIIDPVEIRRYDLVDGKYESKKVASLNDRFCRFLTAGDLDGDGKKEIVAAAFSSGVWVIRREADGSWMPSNIDSQSSGFEHAAYVTDLEADGKSELYVADDAHGILRRYDYRDGVFEGTVIQRRMVPGQAMIWNIFAADLQ